MAKSSAVGTKLNIVHTGTTGTDVIVGGLTSISGIEISADTIDVTSLDNSSGYRDKLAGFKDAGEVSVSGFLDGSDSGQEKMYDLLGSGASSEFEIIFPTSIGKKWSFNGCVTGFKTGADIGDAVTFEATIAVSGEPELE